MNKIQKVAYVSLIALVLLMPVLVFAALPVPVPPITGGAITLAEIQDRITQIARFLIIVGVVLAVIFIIWGGITYMFAGGDAEKATAAKDRIKNGIIGAAVVLAVGVILQTVAGLIARSFFNV
ncbi:MAG: hypothetical protein AAB857_03265 [Patescibacteria group bacterium]